MALAFLNDSYRTPLCVMMSPSAIAAVALTMAVLALYPTMDEPYVRRYCDAMMEQFDDVMRGCDIMATYYGAPEYRSSLEGRLETSSTLDITPTDAKSVGMEPVVEKVRDG
jgi:hypothetical protein